MTTILVTCHNCGFSRDVPAEKLPDRPIQVTCPQCRQSFPFSKSPATAVPQSLPPLRESAAAAALPTDTPRREAGTEPAPATARTTTRPTGLPPPEEPAAADKPAPFALLLLLLLAVIGTGWWLNSPALSAFPADAYLDRKNGFAVKAPADWLMVTPDNYRTIIDQFRDKIPKELTHLIGSGKPGFAVSFLRIPASETDFAPNFNLSIIDTKGKNLPTLTEKEKSDAVTAISREFARQLPTYRLIDSRIVPVDGVDSLQITGEAELTVVTRKASPIYSAPGAFGLRQVTGQTEAEKQTYTIKAIQTMIPGKKRAYALNFMFDDLKTPEMEKVHAEVLNTFSLRERPPRFGAIVMGCLNGGLFGAGLYLFGLIIGRLFRTQQ